MADIGYSRSHCGPKAAWRLCSRQVSGKQRQWSLRGQRLTVADAWDTLRLHGELHAVPPSLQRSGILIQHQLLRRFQNGRFGLQPKTSRRTHSPGTRRQNLSRMIGLGGLLGQHTCMSCLWPSRSRYCLWRHYYRRNYQSREHDGFTVNEDVLWLDVFVAYALTLHEGETAGQTSKGTFQLRCP